VKAVDSVFAYNHLWIISTNKSVMPNVRHSCNRTQFW